MKRTSLLLTGAVLLAIALLGVLTGARSKNGFDAAGAHIVVRKVGHEVLRGAGDSTSPLPPVRQPEPGTYLLSFRKRFPFSPDSLVALINRELATGLPGTDYIVNVIERPSESVVFGYAVLRSRREAIVPCAGRIQPSGLYDLSIRFREAPFWSSDRILGAGIGLLAVGFLLAGSRPARMSQETPASPAEPPAPAPPEAPAAEEDRVALGRYLFVPAQQCLLIDGNTIALTGKESSLLQLFAARPNVVIDRQELQKIWEDEGVIVGRSLDVFVSRLRKKLEHDPNLSLVNIHGKGYKLEVATTAA